MRKWLCVPMMTLLLLCGCERQETRDFRQPFREMTAYTAEAEVACTQGDALWTAELRCSWSVEETVVEVLSPETIAGIKAAMDGETVHLEYGEICLNAGDLGTCGLSPAAGIPRMIAALREGWLLEENDEDWGETPCRRLLLEQTLEGGEKLLTAIWLDRESGLPLRGELYADGEQILTAEFTDFSSCDTINIQSNP